MSEEVLTTTVYELRKAFSDDAREPRYIKTIPRKGYRLIATVEKAPASRANGDEPNPYPGLTPYLEQDVPDDKGLE